jgi:hypothetical protein
VSSRPLPGEIVHSKTAYFRRAGVKRKKKRRGFSPGLSVLGIHDRCPPECAAELRHFAGIVSSFAEAEQVLRERGIEIGEESIRRIRQRDAHRAQAAQPKGVRR